MPGAVVLAAVGAAASTGIAAVGASLIADSLFTTFAVHFGTSKILGSAAGPVRSDSDHR